MGSSAFRLLVLISLILNSFSVLAQLVNTTLHSTHPQVTYTPESCCIKDGYGRCTKRYDPFTMSTYVDPNSMNRTFFQTTSEGNEPNSSTMKRRIEIKFYGRAVYVYGPPRAKLDNRPGHIQISLDGSLMTTIDLEVTYNERNVDWRAPRLMYHWEGIGGDASHTLTIILLDAGYGRGFGFDSLVATSLEPFQPPKYELSESEQVKEVEIHDTNFVTKFTPSYAWLDRSTRASEVIRTFHGTSNEMAYKLRATAMMPVAEFPARCAALKIYGASPAQLERAFTEGFWHGHLQICQDRLCRYIDAHQAYLHVPKHLWDEPVLLYSNDRMSPRASTTVTMRLLNPWSPVGHQWIMSFSHAVCSQVVPKWPWTHPITNGNYSTHLVQSDKLGYAPSYLFGAFSAWTWMGQYRFALAKPYWFSSMFQDMPSWSTVVQGHDIKVLVPSPARFPELHYSSVRCCIDGECHYPDIERWLTGVTEAHSDVLLVQYQDLDPFRDHRISVTAVRRNDEVGDKFIAVSRVEYQQVVIATPGPSPAPKPAPTSPAVAVIAIATFILVGGFALWRLLDSRRLQPETRPLIPPNHTAPPSYFSAVMTEDLDTSLPQPHVPITVPAAPPPREVEPEAPLRAPTRQAGGSRRNPGSGWNAPKQ